MKNPLLAFGISLILFSAGCSQDSSENTNLSSARAKSSLVNNVRDYDTKRQGILLQNLPQKSVAYFRVPSLLGGLDNGEGGVLHPLVETQAMQNQVAAIHKGLSENLISKIDEPTIKSMMAFFIEYQRAPIEVAVIPGAGGLFNPNVFLLTELNIDGVEPLKKLIQALVSSSQGQLELVNDVSPEGEFELVAGPVSIFAYFDSTSKELAILGGMATARKTLTTLRDRSIETRSDLLDFEKTIDDSGSGLSLWIDTKTLYTQLGPMAPAEIREQIQLFQPENSEFLWAGSGTKNGHASFRIHLQNKVGTTSPFHFATADQVRELKVALPMKTSVSFPLPNKKHLERLMTFGVSENYLPLEWKQQITRIKETQGYDLNELLTVFGPSGIYVNDRSGSWAGYPIENENSLNNTIKWLTTYYGARFETKTVSGLEISHLTIPSFTKLASEQMEGISNDQMPAWLMQFLNAGATHMYWLRDGDNLIMANVPQVLISRQRHLSKVSAQQWLTSNGLDWNENILGASTQSENLPRNIYHYTLQALQLISDVAGVEPNLMAMPLAEDLNLPEQGRVSVQLKLGENATSIVLDYEQSAADFVLGVGSTATMVAVVGILAAVAIPAYQDYTVRAKVSEVILATHASRLMLSEYYLANGKLPEQSDEPYRGFSNAADIDFNAESGAIEIIFNDSIPQLTDAQINFQAYPSASGGIEWRCENVSAKESVVPSSCRN